MIAVAATSPAWLTALIVVAAPGAALAGVYATIHIDHRRGEREAEQTAAVRAAVRADAREGFQRETLLQVQDALQRFTRNVAQIHMHDMDAHRHQRDGGRWGSTQHGLELSEEARQNLVATRHLSGRLLDEVVRDQVAVAVETASLATASAPSEEVATERLRQAFEAVEAADAVLAAAFRSIA